MFPEKKLATTFVEIMTCKIFIFACFFLIQLNFAKSDDSKAKINIDVNQYSDRGPTSKHFGLFIEFLEDYVNGPGGMWAQEIMDRGFDLPNCQGVNIGCVWKDSVSQGNPMPYFIEGGYNENGRYFKRMISQYDSGFAATYQQIAISDTTTHSAYVYYKGKSYGGIAKVMIFTKNNLEKIFEIER